MQVPVTSGSPFPGLTHSRGQAQSASWSSKARRRELNGNTKEKKSHTIIEKDQEIFFKKYQLAIEQESGQPCLMASVG